MGLRYEETDCRKCCVSDFKNDLCKKDFCEKYYREGNAEVFEKLLPHWIPCGERLPDNEVLCCDNHGEMMLGYVFACDDGKTPYSAENEHEYMYDCVAWMPLPEPYKEGTE